MKRRVRLEDLVVVGLIAVFAWLGVRVHDSVAGLADMAQGIQETGTSIQRSGATAGAQVRRSVGAAAEAADQLPLVGGQVAAALRETARSTAASIERESRTTGAQLARSGRQGEDDARETARLIGWLAFLIPTVALLAQAVPRWIRRRSWPADRSAHPAGGTRSGGAR
jgi:hypothetical protein